MEETKCGWSRGQTLYDEKYCKAIVQHCAEGRSLISFAVFLGVGSSTVQKWVKAHPEFAEAHIAAKEAQMVYYENIALDQAKGEIRGGNAASLIFILKNRFSEHYRDRQEVDMKGEVNFLINTGIVRTPIDAPVDSIEAESKVLEDSDLI